MHTEGDKPGRLPEDAGGGPAPSGPAGAPEPPVRHGHGPRPGPVAPDGGKRPRPELEAVRRTVAAARVMALVSLVIGGVVLSTAALVTAVAGYRKASAGAALGRSGEAASWLGMRRLAVAAIVMGAVALALNVAALAYVYPMVLDMVQSGDYASLWDGAGSTPSPSTSIWG